MKIISRNNTLYLDFSHNGQRVRKSVKMEDTVKNRSIIQKQIIPEIQRQLVMGEFFEKETTYTLDEFAKISFSLHKSKRKELTHISYVEDYNLHISPLLGKMYITDL